MKAVFKIERPKDVEVTMSITLRLKDWMDLRSQLQNVYPSWSLSGTIDTLVSKATKEFFEYAPDKNEENNDDR